LDNQKKPLPNATITISSSVPTTPKFVYNNQKV